MSRSRFWIAVATLGIGCLFVPVAQSQPGAKRPKTQLEPVAETKLLMEGLVGPNMRGLANLLRDKPLEADAWRIARGQSLLIGETGNLLLMRPPRNAEGQEAWQQHATQLRETATTLAQAVAEKDYAKARSALAGVANVCNRCHQAFRVPNRIDPFQGE